MSHVTDIILITGIEDGANYKHCESDHPNARKLSPRLIQVNDFAGGGKAMQCSIFMGAENDFSIPFFLECFYDIKWESPERVQLMIKDEHDEAFTIYVPKEAE